MKKKMNRKGFTLVEIIVVLVIIAIMAAFAIPAYTGFVDRAKQSEVLASGRVILVAAQTAAQETYSKDGSLTAADATDQATLLGLIETYSKITGVGKAADTSGLNYTVTVSTTGEVTGITYTDGTYQAVYSGGDWTTSKPATPILRTSVTIS